MSASKTTMMEPITMPAIAAPLRDAELPEFEACVVVDVEDETLEIETCVEAAPAGPEDDSAEDTVAWRDVCAPF
jgi:hypothetical protein